MSSSCIDEAQRLMKEKKYDEAFRYFDYLLHTSPDDTTLQAIGSGVFAGQRRRIWHEQGNYQHALAILEEVTRRDARYRAAEVATRIAQRGRYADRG